MTGGLIPPLPGTPPGRVRPGKKRFLIGAAPSAAGLHRPRCARTLATGVSTGRKASTRGGGDRGAGSAGTLRADAGRARHYTARLSIRGSCPPLASVNQDGPRCGKPSRFGMVQRFLCLGRYKMAVQRCGRVLDRRTPKKQGFGGFPFDKAKLLESGKNSLRNLARPALRPSALLGVLGDGRELGWAF
jgi:hypothetical protein